MAHTITSYLLWTGIEASLLAIFVFALTRAHKFASPVRHLLWMLVLIKLLMPPVVENSLSASAGVARAIHWADGQCQAWLSDVTFARPNTAAGPQVPAGPDNRFEPYSDIHGSGQFDSLHPRSLPSVEFLPSDQSWDLLAAIDDLPLEQTMLRGMSASIEQGEPEPSEPNASKSPVAFGFVRSHAIRLLVWVWCVGTAAFVCVRLVQLYRVRQLIGRGENASSMVLEEARAIAAKIGVPLPRLRLLNEPIAPMLSVVGRPVVLLPLPIVGSRMLVRNVLAHELAHLKRRDHWVCWLELMAGCVFWWLPTYWWCRAELRRASDESADGWAVWVVGSRRSYAASLLETVEKLTANPVVPVLGPALGERETIARRLTMIMRERLSHRVPWSARAAVLLAGVLVMPVAPGRLQAQDPPAPPAEVEQEPREDVAAELVREAGRDRPSVADTPEPPQPPSPPQPPQPGSVPRLGNPAPPQAATPRPPRGDRPWPGEAAPRDTERRLRELEQKLDRVLEHLDRVTSGQMSAFDPTQRRSATSSGLSVPRVPAVPRVPPLAAPANEFDSGRDPAIAGHRHAMQELQKALSDKQLTDDQREQLEQVAEEMRMAYSTLAQEHARAIQEFQKKMTELERIQGELVKNVVGSQENRREAASQREEAEKRAREAVNADRRARDAERRAREIQKAAEDKEKEELEDF